MSTSGVNPGANTGLNDDAEVLREYELMLLSLDGDAEFKHQWYSASDDRALMDVNKASVLNIWEEEV